MLQHLTPRRFLRSPFVKQWWENIFLWSISNHKLSLIKDLQKSIFEPTLRLSGLWVLVAHLQEFRSGPNLQAKLRTSRALASRGRPPIAQLPDELTALIFESMATSLLQVFEATAPIRASDDLLAIIKFLTRNDYVLKLSVEEKFAKFSGKRRDAREKSCII